jgi:hypothetical protein
MFVSFKVFQHRVIGQCKPLARSSIVAADAGSGRLHGGYSSAVLTHLEPHGVEDGERTGEADPEDPGKVPHDFQILQ